MSDNPQSSKEDTKIVTRLLRDLPTSLLNQSMPGITQFLVDMEENPTPSNIADALAVIKGSTIFENRIIRDEIFKNAGIEAIVQWTDNPNCRNALKTLGISDGFLPLPRRRRDLSIELTLDPKLHDYQDWMKRQVSKFILSRNNENLMVQMPTGSGKTWTMMESIYDFLRIHEEEGKGVVWLANRDELCEQAVSSFKNGWLERGSSDITILRLWGGNTNELKEIPNQSFFAVTSFQSLHSMIETRHDHIFGLFAEIKRRNALLIVDEAHQAKAPTYEQSIQQIKPYGTSVIGLSATPGRDSIDGDGIDTEELASLFDNNLYTINEFCHRFNKTPIRYLQDKKILSSVKYSQLKTDYSIELNADEKKSFKKTMRLPESFLKRAGEDIKRNTLIMTQIIKLVEDFKKKPLVFAPSKNNSDFLASLLIFRGIKAKSVTGETSATDRQIAVEDFKSGEIQVLLNYGVFTTGFDEPSIDCVMIARPTTSVVLYSQMIGRGLRGPLNGGTKDCMVVDVIDNLDNQPDIDLANNFFHDYWSTN